MQYSSRHLEELVTQLGRLPGIGKKTAQRLAFHLLRVEKNEALGLSRAIERVVEEVGHCERCGNVAETQPCYLCSDEKRNPRLLCIVEQPGDVVALERTGAFKGLYHVLRGAVSPLDGVGPNDLKTAQLLERLERDGVTEVILALNPTNQGEATSHILAEILAGKGISISRIARGVPMGSEIELSDAATLVRALEGRLRI